MPAIPHSIYEIPGAKTCAIEFRSFSKTAGFTGARCGYTVVPHDLVREGQSLNAMWNRRQTTKFNGASYVIQRGAAAIYTPEGAAQVDETIDFYRTNARTIKEGLAAAGLEVYGADNSPYVWCRTPNGASSWDFFNRLLEEANVTPPPAPASGRPARAISAHRLRRRRGHQGGGRAHQADARCRESRLAEAHHGIGAQSSPRAVC